MRLNSRAGRATVAALAFVVVSGLAGTLLLARKAQAQQAPPPQLRRSFGPVFLVDPTAQTPGNTGELIGLLLPAVQRVRSEVLINFVNGDADIPIPVAMGDGSRRMASFDAFITNNRAGGGNTLHVIDRSSNHEYTAPTQFSDVTVVLLPAVQYNGIPIWPTSESDAVRGFADGSFADGSVEILPYIDFLPAVQDVVR